MKDDINLIIEYIIPQMDKHKDLLIEIENWLLDNFWNSESYPSTYYQEEPDIELVSNFDNLQQMLQLQQEH